MKVKILYDLNIYGLEKLVNEFIKDKEVKEIQFSASNTYLFAMIIYR